MIAPEARSAAEAELREDVDELLEEYWAEALGFGTYTYATQSICNALIHIICINICRFVYIYVYIIKIY